MVRVESVDRRPCRKKTDDPWRTPRRVRSANRGPGLCCVNLAPAAQPAKETAPTDHITANITAVAVAFRVGLSVFLPEDRSGRRSRSGAWSRSAKSRRLRVAPAGLRRSARKLKQAVRRPLGFSRMAVGRNPEQHRLVSLLGHSSIQRNEARTGSGGRTEIAQKVPILLERDNASARLISIRSASERAASSRTALADQEPSSFLR
jgi:hypothetical protein